MYNRMGCRSIQTLLSANEDSVWDDTTIHVNNDLISMSDHDIARIRKWKRNKVAEVDPHLKPGQILCMVSYTAVHTAIKII